MNEPGPAIFPPDHLGFAVEPDDSPIPRQHTVGGPQRFARKKQLSRFHAPSLLVVGMDLLIPADGVLQPLLLRETQDSFNLRADVSLAHPLVQVGHEYNRGNLLYQRPVFRLQVGKRSFCRLSGFDIGAVSPVGIGGGALEEHAGQFLQNQLCAEVTCGLLAHIGHALQVLDR